MSSASITFFPVGNGDTTLIQLTDKTNILVDCDLRLDTGDVWDVHASLLEVLSHDAKKRPHLEIFILTHPDQDHCRGFKSKFYQGAPEEYSSEDAEEQRIIIDEIWFAPRIFHEYDDPLSKDAEAFKNEADRRLELYRSGDPSRNLDGNRVRVVGATDHPGFDGLEGIMVVAGAELTLKDDFTVFVHAPFKANTDDEEGDRNESSIVLQLRFDVSGQQEAALVLLGGDATYSNWERIVERSDDPTLEWDLFLAPHHCSWSFFGPDSANDSVSATSEYVLERGRKGASIIASCKPIRNDDDNPPHYAAYEIYRDHVGEDNVLCTMMTASEESPEPITFSMTVNGPVLVDNMYGKRHKSSAVTNALNKPRTYG